MQWYTQSLSPDHVHHKISLSLSLFVPLLVCLGLFAIKSFFVYFCKLFIPYISSLDKCHSISFIALITFSMMQQEIGIWIFAKFWLTTQRLQMFKPNLARSHPSIEQHIVDTLKLWRYLLNTGADTTIQDADWKILLHKVTDIKVECDLTNSCNWFTPVPWNPCFNPFPHNDIFWRPWKTSLLKTLWEK